MLIKWCNTQNLIYHLKPMNSRTVFPDYIPWELRTTGRRAPCLPKPLGAVLLLPCLVYFACWKGSEAWQTLQVLTQLPRAPASSLLMKTCWGKQGKGAGPASIQRLLSESVSWAWFSPPHFQILVFSACPVGVPRLAKERQMDSWVLLHTYENNV